MQAKVVTICGSMKFRETMEELSERLELERGWAVIGVVPHVLDRALTESEKARLGALHRTKIDLSDAIYVVNVGGYVGESVRAEIEYARECGKEILWLEEPEI